MSTKYFTLMLLTLITVNAVAQEQANLERREMKILHSRFGGNALRQKVVRYISPSRPMEVLQPKKIYGGSGRGMLARPDENNSQNGLWDGPSYFVNWQTSANSQTDDSK